MGRRGARIFSFVRNFLSTIVNKEFLIFLFFLSVSGLFWLVITVTETYEREFSVPLRLVNVPKDIVVTSEVDDTVKVTIRDKGYILLAYKYTLTDDPISIDYKLHAPKDEKSTVSTSELQKLIYQQLYKSSRIISLKPDRLVYYFTRGKSKTVPLRLNGRIVMGQSHYVSRIVFSPERVDVYARKSLLDSIHYAFTENMVISNLTDTIVRTVALKKVLGAKFVPSEVKVTIYPDILTEANVEVPITAVNMPEGKTLRTFPSRVKVLFVTGVGNVRNISANQFRVEADYSDIEAHPSEKCSLSIVGIPQGVRNPRLEISEVDYLIETQ
ncbi:MAG: YbbR-like domain-containing protein [Prevotella sp.]|nr:YbbR-like domain-containing protein [Prevotella sp.]